MADDVEHVENATPDASDEDVKRVDEDTEQNADPGAAVDQGVGQNPTDSTDPDQNEDPKSGHSPV